MKDKIIQFYETTRQYYGTYHNHKEVSAWAALVLYGLLANLLSNLALPAAAKVPAAVVVTAFTLGAAFLICRYISKQLEMKDLAGAYSAAASFLLLRIISSDMDDGQLRLYTQVEESGDTNAQSAHVLPIELLRKARILNTRGRGFQDATRGMTYSILVLTTVLVVVTTWEHAVG